METEWLVELEMKYWYNVYSNQDMYLSVTSYYPVGNNVQCITEMSAINLNLYVKATFISYKLHVYFLGIEGSYLIITNNV